MTFLVCFVGVSRRDRGDEMLVFMLIQFGGVGVDKKNLIKKKVCVGYSMHRGALLCWLIPRFLSTNFF